MTVSKILKTGLENMLSNLLKEYHLKSPYNIHTAQKINFWYKTIPQMKILAYRGYMGEFDITKIFVLIIWMYKNERKNNRCLLQQRSF